MHSTKTSPLSTRLASRRAPGSCLNSPPAPLAFRVEEGLEPIDQPLPPLRSDEALESDESLDSRARGGGLRGIGNGRDEPAA